jgi:hypothetical protein
VTVGISVVAVDQALTYPRLSSPNSDLRFRH